MEACRRQNILCRICIRNGEKEQYQMSCKSDVDSHFETFHPEIAANNRIAFIRVCDGPVAPQPKPKFKEDPKRTAANKIAIRGSGAFKKEPDQMKDHRLNKTERELNILRQEVKRLHQDKLVLEKALSIKKEEEVGGTSSSSLSSDGEELKKALKEIHFLRQEVDVQEYDKKVLKNELEALKQQVNVLHYDKFFFDKTIKELEDELRSSREERGELRATVVDQHGSIHSLEEKCTELEAIKGHLQRQLESIKSEHDKERMAFEDILEERKRDLEQAQRYMDSRLKIKLKLGLMEKKEELEEAYKEIQKLKEGSHASTLEAQYQSQMETNSKSSN